MPGRGVSHRLPVTIVTSRSGHFTDRGKFSFGRVDGTVRRGGGHGGTEKTDAVDRRATGGMFL